MAILISLSLLPLSRSTSSLLPSKWSTLSRAKPKWLRLGPRMTMSKRWSRAAHSVVLRGRETDKIKTTMGTSSFLLAPSHPIVFLSSPPRSRLRPNPERSMVTLGYLPPLHCCKYFLYVFLNLTWIIDNIKIVWKTWDEMLTSLALISSDLRQWPHCC